MKKYLVECLTCEGGIAIIGPNTEKGSSIVDAESKEEAIELVKTNVEEQFDGYQHLDPDEATERERNAQGDLIFKNDSDKIVFIEYDFTAKEIKSY